ncbi:MAG: choice-of-anchor J domain-containing protein, partial [Candidatus Cloacimonetes bacterium]|nr:choice-of-anchor J domain-containing protein [Candidatus Cloacimonadota bacterium]
SVPNPGLPFNLSAGQTANVVVYYSPTEAGLHTALMVITDGTTRIPHNINLSGTGVQTATNLYPPTNLQASIQGNEVQLSWDAPEPPPTGEWITWCDPADLGNGIGTNGAATFDIAHRFDATDLTAYQGSTLTHVKFVPNEVQSTYTVKIWTGGTATTPGNMIHSQLVANPVIGEWNTVVLNTPIPVPATQLWIGVGIVAQAGYPAGCDDGPQVEGKGNIMNFNGWTTLSQVNAELTYNWSIQGYVDDFRTLAFTPQAIEETTVTYAEGTFAKNGTNRNVTRAQTGYKVYRNDAVLATLTEPGTTTYIDQDLALGEYEYYVTATYDNGESLPTNTVEVEIEELDPPTDLAGTVEGNDVSLNWTSPQPPLEGEWISWSNNDLLDNSIGTNGAANFDVAHRYDATDILPHVGGTLAAVKFAPMYANAVYTVKIWTGGTATVPGTLVHSQVAQNPVINDWTNVILSNPVPITGDQIWIGYNVNTQGGLPAGCDMGPQVEGKGNMMYINNAWTTLSQVNAELTYNWQIQGLVVQNGSYKAISLSPIAEAAQPITSGTFKNARNAAKNSSRAVLTGFKVYRDDALIATISDPSVTTYTDMNLPNATYVYGVSAVYTNGESEAALTEVVVNLELAPVIFEDSFETYEDFALTMAPWTLLDQDGSATYGFSNITFPNSEAPMAFIAFNPSMTVPPITGMDPYEGSKMAASFAAVTPPNSDWLITPRLNLGDNSSIKFYAKSHTNTYGLERFRVGVSTAPAIYPQLFTYVTGTDYVEAPMNWTEYHYDLSAYDNQSVYIGIRSVSNDAFVFYVDNVSVHSGASSNDDNSAPVVRTELKGNYPNPFNPQTTIRYSVKENSPVSIEVYNLKGQLVKRLVNSEKAAGEHSIVWNGTDLNNRPVSSGVYFYKMNAGKYSATKKMIMMK